MTTRGAMLVVVFITIGLTWTVMKILNPDKTDTRMMFDYWPLYIASLVVIVATAIWVSKGPKP